MNKTVVLDVGALIAVERRSHQMQELVQVARSRRIGIVVPMVVVAQVVRSGGRQANLRRFLTDPYLRFVGLDYPMALKIGALLGESGTGDVVDAAVVVCARESGLAPVVTSDPHDLRKLDSAVPLIVV